MDNRRVGIEADVVLNVLLDFLLLRNSFLNSQTKKLINLPIQTEELMLIFLEFLNKNPKYFKRSADKLIVGADESGDGLELSR